MTKYSFALLAAWLAIATFAFPVAAILTVKVLVAAFILYYLPVIVGYIGGFSKVAVNTANSFAMAALAKVIAK